MSDLRDELAEAIYSNLDVYVYAATAERVADAILPIIERETTRARAESEAKARRFANLLGNNAKALNDTLPREVLRQKAEAWDQCEASWLAYMLGDSDDPPTHVNPYRKDQP